VADLPGRPDIVFVGARVAVFCDGDFWHGRNLRERVRKLKRGHNAPYWVTKITSNVARDRRHDRDLVEEGWLVLRFWESDIHRDAAAIATRVAATVATRKR
jgi:DNA mismatch endonuclease (patch repair protein)